MEFIGHFNMRTYQRFTIGLGFLVSALLLGLDQLYPNRTLVFFSFLLLIVCCVWMIGLSAMNEFGRF